MAPNPSPSSATRSGIHRVAAGVDAAEVARLRAIIEKQASCLMRVGIDGTLLAVSDAALSLLGARELAEVLDTNFVQRLDAGAASVWADFADRVAQSGSGSAECEMTDLAGTRRAVLLLGVALPDHPDGVRSVLVTVRDVSTARRLEASLQEQEELRRSIEEERSQLATSLADGTAILQQLRARLEEGIAERRQLHAALEEAVAQRQQIARALDQLMGTLSTALDDVSVTRQILAKEPPK